MSRTLAALLVALAPAACTRSAPQEVAAPPATTAVPAAPAAATAPPAIDDALVGRFLAFEKAYLEGLPPRLATMQRALASLEKQEKLVGPAAGAKSASDRTQALLEKMKADDRDLRTRAGLSEEQVEALEDLMRTIGAAAQLAAPAQVEALQGARRRYGDAAVDAVLRRKAELSLLWKRQMQIFQETMQAMARGH